MAGGFRLWMEPSRPSRLVGPARGGTVFFRFFRKSSSFASSSQKEAILQNPHLHPMQPIQTPNRPEPGLSNVLAAAQAEAWRAALSCVAVERSRFRLHPEAHAEDVSAACDRWLARRAATKSAGRSRAA